MRILAVGDLHLGRRPTRLPAGLDPADCGPAAAWARAVERALALGVRAVLLAGDVVDHDDDFFEGFRALEDGARRLRAGGIDVIAVAGNHDGRVLPRLAERVEGVRLLGRGGRWERAVLEADGERLSVWGWSFPDRHFPSDPARGFRIERDGGLHLGLLHCDLDARAGGYAPTARASLEAAGADGWLLGHIHVPDALHAPEPLGYLGAVTALDRADLGPRGPWLLELAGGRVARVAHLPLAPLRRERLALDLTGLAAPDEARDRLLDAARARAAELAGAGASPEAVALHLALSGASPHADAAAALLRDEAADLPVPGGARWFVAAVDNRAEPPVPVERLAERADPAGILARRLRLLDAPADDPGRRALLAAARRHLAPVAGRAEYAALDAEAPLTDADLAERLRRQALALLRAALDREAG